MRVTRGLVASLGASGCIAAAGACALLAVSATIGFRGWPGLGHGAVSAETIRATTAPAATRRAVAVAVLAGRADGHALAATEAPGDLPTTPGASAGTGAPATAGHPRRPSGTSVPAATQTASRAPAQPATRATSTAGEAVRATGERVGSAVAPTSPAAAQTVTNAAGTAGDAVDQVGGGLP